MRLPGGVAVARGPVPAGARFRGHEHDGLHLCGVLGGGFVEATRHGPEDAGTGTLRVSPGARHDIDFGPGGASCVLVHVGPEVAREAGLRPAATTFLRDPALGPLVRRLGTGAARAGPAAELDLEGTAIELVALLARERSTRLSGTPGWLRRAREAIHEAGREPATLSGLAEEVGVHRCHLARAFRDRYGVPVGAYYRRIRLKRCLRLLAGEAPLARVALEAGFADQSHMTRELTARFGTPPGRFRERRHRR